MAKGARQAVAPLYLLLCLVLGGSAQGIWANLLLQLVGLGILAWAIAAPADKPARPARQLLVVAGIAICLVLLQLIPLPASLWASLGGREELAQDYALLGLKAPALPVSLTPYRSLNSLLGAIPPLAMICAIVRLKASKASWLMAALVAGTIGGVLLGALQVASTASPSHWYLYPETNVGVAVGFFANANHMAILLVVVLPFLAAAIAAARSSTLQQRSAVVALVVGVSVVVIVGIVLNRSVAGYGLAVPVLLGSALIILPGRSSARPILTGLALISLLGGMGLIAANRTGPGRLGVETSVQTRQAMLRTTARAIADFMPLGSGLGSFAKVYPLYEDAAQVTDTYVVHAHNDYAEVALEAGLPGVLLMLAFLAWWGRASLRVWRSAEPAPFARAAAIASAAILAHSLVDFPLRTAAIASVFAACLALLADGRASPASDPGDLRPTRHVEFP